MIRKECDLCFEDAVFEGAYGTMFCEDCKESELARIRAMKKIKG